MTEAKAITCPVCENVCSSQAVACPKCGHPINHAPTIVHVEKDEGPEKADAGGVLRGVLWVFFAISCLYALGAISIANNKPLPVRCIISPCSYSNEAEISAANFAIAYHIAPLVIMIIILAIVYSARGRR